MTDSEIRDWASLLVDPKLSTSQLIQNLLNNAKEDRMTLNDKVICIRAMQLIKKGVIRDYPAVPSRNSLHSGLSLSDGLDGSEQEQE